MNAPVSGGEPTWTTFYDSTGQAATLVVSSAQDELGVQFIPDRLVLTLQGASAPGPLLAGSFGLSGSISLTTPEELRLSGLLLVVDGSITRTPGTQAVVMCAIGHGSRTREWPLASVAGAPGPDPSPTGGGVDGGRGEAGGNALSDEEFRIESFVSDFNPSSVGQPPFPPLPPVPITLGVHGRIRGTDEALRIGITGFEVILLATP